MPFDHKFVVVGDDEERAEVTFAITLREPLKVPKDASRTQMEALRATKLSDMKKRIIEEVKKELALQEVKTQVAKTT